MQQPELTKYAHKLTELLGADVGFTTHVEVLDLIQSAYRDGYQDAENQTALWKCGCLRNSGDAHRVGCPEHPAGKRSNR